MRACIYVCIFNKRILSLQALFTLIGLSSAWYATKEEEVVRNLKTSLEGLSLEEANIRVRIQRAEKTEENINIADFFGSIQEHFCVDVDRRNSNFHHNWFF